jgi:hypothetical protein
MKRTYLSNSGKEKTQILTGYLTATFEVPTFVFV